MQTTDSPLTKTAYATVPEVPYGSHLIRLSWYEWLTAFAVIVGFFVFTPILWGWFAPLECGNDYRIPYALSQDYWTYQRYSALQTKSGKIPVVGDSVIWGEYVLSEQTFVHYLNEAAGSPPYANLGVNGTHPMALAGLVSYYGRAIRNTKVFLHFNPLWMSSPRHDLQSEKEFNFNHPRLVPQFLTRIPCYRASFSERANAVTERYVSFMSWAGHLRVTYFDQQDLPSWSLEHPYAIPVAQFASANKEAGDSLRHEPVSWEASGKRKQDFPWVELETSLQWDAFKRTLKTLEGRGNQVFVLVGPFNEHILEDNSLKKYRGIKTKIEAWLKTEGTAHIVPEPLPSTLYADTSHPLAEGYERLARQLGQAPVFKTWLNAPSQ